MKGDISRDTFDARKHYSGVAMQQGRVQLDADWNEQQSINHHRAETGARDIIGSSGAPLHDAGFRITTPDGTLLQIGSGRYYVAGLLCENEALVDYLRQPDFPGAPPLDKLLQAAGASAGIVYLDAWRRTVTALDDPGIREVALGGPDTALRVKTVWQVKILPIKFPVAGATLSCGDQASEWDALVARSTGQMSARSLPVQATGNPCLLPPGAGYTRLENQLYRVEVHKGGTLADATFKWSRDNASLITAIENFNGQVITAHDLGRDEASGFANGQWVEIGDDGAELSGLAGQLIQIDHIDESARTVTLKSPPAIVDPALRPKLRRWDSAGALALAAAGDGWIGLEEGVQVKFEAGTYKTGDYWLVPARTVTGNVEWPFATPQLPKGIIHHYCRLGIVTPQGAALSLQDCRNLFAPIAEVVPAIHIAAVSWVNDDVITQAQLLANGLQVIFDNPVSPLVTATGLSALSVTLVAPFQLKAISPPAETAIALPQSVVLSGELSLPAPNSLLWKPAKSGAELASLTTLLAAEQVGRVLLRVALNGAVVWSNQGDQRLYLDGSSRGQEGLRSDGSQRVDLIFPSGDARRSSDFQSWLFVQLQVPPANLAAVALDSALVNAGANATGTLVLDHPAPEAGVTVTLTSSSPAVVVPPNVQVAAGKLQASFDVKTSKAVAQNTLNVLVSASLNGLTQTAPLTVQVVHITLSPVDVAVFINFSLQFIATVTGTEDQGIIWSVQEPGGAGITSGGMFSATSAGDFHIVATSTADPTVKAVAIAHSQLKPKDKDKENIKENRKENRIEVNKIIDGGAKVFEKVHLEVKAPDSVSFTPPLPGSNPAAPSLAAIPFDKGDELAPGRAFIRPVERPSLAPQVVR